MFIELQNKAKRVKNGMDARTELSKGRLSYNEVRLIFDNFLMGFVEKEWTLLRGTREKRHERFVEVENGGEDYYLIARTDENEVEGYGRYACELSNAIIHITLVRKGGGSVEAKLYPESWFMNHDLLNLESEVEKTVLYVGEVARCVALGKFKEID